MKDAINKNSATIDTTILRLIDSEERLEQATGPELTTSTAQPFIFPRRTAPLSTATNTSGPPIELTNQFSVLAPSAEHQQEEEQTTDANSTMRTEVGSGVRRSDRRRPVVCCSENHLNNFKPIRPGRGSFANSVKRGRRVFIATDSMAQRIRKREFYSHVENGFVNLKPFPGVTSTYLHHYILPHLIEESPDTLVLHVGTNSIHD